MAMSSYRCDGKEGGGNGLRLLVLGVTADCNLRCRYCSARGGEEKAHMSEEVARRAVDLMAERSKKFKVQFTGGEPLLNLDLIEKVVLYLEEGGADALCQVQTNATLITAEMADRLKGLGIGVGVSLDGPPGSDDLRPSADGGGSVGAAVAGIKNLGDAGIRVGMTCVLAASNFMKLPALVELASYLGNVDGITLDPVRPVGRAGREMVPDPATAARYLDMAIDRAEMICQMGGNRVKFRELERMKLVLSAGNRRLCHCQFDACQSLVVTPGGEVYSCPSLLSPEFRLGDIMDPSIGGGLLEGLKDARDIIEPHLPCRRCPDFWLCGGSCPAYSFSMSGDVGLECAIKGVFMRRARKAATMDEQL
ncbi:MAG: molybdenum cofactor biosynthesis protein A [Methanosaeta sp. PtaU1.Bin055]|nr:MAG: molybdenum cofactor biosynthesis protein A [Methanosaeta sp. PtaU1.Bin055]